MLNEELLDLVFILLKDGESLTVKLLLDLLQLIAVVITHLLELLHHRLDQTLDIVVHLLHRLDVVIVLGIKLVDELLNKRLLVGDDLRASLSLGFDVLLEVQT